MNSDKFRMWVGGILITVPILINIPYSILIATFDYPDILRESAGTILANFHKGGVGLILTWWSFAIVGAPLLFSIVGLYQLMKSDRASFLLFGTVLGLVSAVAQMIGLLRWTFVVPILAQTYSDPLSSQATRDATTVVFQAIHQYGGVIVGEHIGQTFTIIWMALVSIAMFKSLYFKPWLGWFGLASAFVYLTAQLELFQTVIPRTPVVSESGLIGSLLWLLWLVLTGVSLVRFRAATSPVRST